MKKLLLLPLLFMAFACKKELHYTYVEYKNDPALVGGGFDLKVDSVAIAAETDSAAYLDAYTKFIIAQKVYNDMKARNGDYVAIPLKFQLLNNKQIDISSTINFSKKDSLEKQLADRINGMRSSAPKISETATAPKVDEAAIKKLKPYFTLKKDEFDASGSTWYTPKSAPAYSNYNALYCYFEVTDNRASNLRFRLHYVAEDWLFIEKIQFSIDGEAYEMTPSDVKRDNDGGEIWEWFDEGVNYSNSNIIEALANAKTAKMKILGQQYYKIKPITAKQILNIKRTLDLYRAMGGEL